MNNAKDGQKSSKLGKLSGISILKKKFIKIVLSILLVFLLLAGIIVFVLFIIAKKRPEPPSNGDVVTESGDVIAEDHIVTTFAIFGRDSDSIHTDTIIFVRFMTNGDIDFLSVPRDTRIELSEAVENEMQKRDLYYHRICKINEVHAYAGPGYRNAASKAVLEELLGEKIHYSIFIDLEGFREIVDTIGGVEFDVPMDMLYSDPEQDLYIDLKKGSQVLMGQQAEQLVRFRSGYDEQDIERIQVQQEFFKELLKKVLSTEVIMKNANTYLKAFFDYIETDMPLTEAIKYLKYLPNIDTQNMKMFILPGKPERIDATDYFIVDEVQTKNLLNIIMFGKSREIESTEESFEESSDSTKVTSLIDIKQLKIEILNGSYKTGLAANYKEEFENFGFTDVDIGTFEGDKVEKTRIYLRNQDLLDEFYGFFSGEVDFVDETSLIKDGFDVLIILGMDE